MTYVITCSILRLCNIFILILRYLTSVSLFNAFFAEEVDALSSRVSQKNYLTDQRILRQNSMSQMKVTLEIIL